MRKFIFPVYELKLTLREKCPNMEFFLVRISGYSVRIQENTEQKKLRKKNWTLFTQCNVLFLKFLRYAFL